MSNQCKKCGSYGFNLWRRGIDQGDLCDPHYWEYRYQEAKKASEVLEGTLRKISDLSLAAFEDARQ